MSAIAFDIKRLVPRFLYQDKNGYAICKAVEAAFQYVSGRTQDGIDCVLDVDKMPEWRLDEMAWELDCLYEYDADIESKRIWIKNAAPYYSLYGTVAGVKQYIEGRFENVDVQEWWQYDGDPYHFRVVVDGEWTEENVEWAQKAVDTTKNVRSALDGIIFSSGSTEADAYVGVFVGGIYIQETPAFFPAG